MGQHDGHFFNRVSVVLGSLVALAIVLFGVARSIGSPFEEARAALESEQAAQVAANTAPVGRVAIAGQDNRALSIPAPADGAAPSAPALPKTAEATFEAVCSACHGAGIGGAPKVGDRAAWGPRIGQGKATLYAHALSGFAGRAGVMLAKGGRGDLPDRLVEQTVDYMVQRSQ